MLLEIFDGVMRMARIVPTRDQERSEYSAYAMLRAESSTAHLRFGLSSTSKRHDLYAWRWCWSLRHTVKAHPFGLEELEAGGAEFAPGAPFLA